MSGGPGRDQRDVDLDRTPEELCELAGLVHVDPADAGWTRRPQGRGFSYRTSDGEVISGSARDRLEALAIPPAWTEVWICPRTDGHLVAVGRDDAGRLQHLYHPDFRAQAEAVKYERLGPFGARLQLLRRTVVDDMMSDDPRRRTVAGAVRLLDRGLVRVGSTQPEDPDGAVGATTLPPSCVTVDQEAGTIEIHFVGKGGSDRAVHLDDEPLLAQVLADGVALAADTAFAYQDEEGAARDVSAREVNDYLREATGLPFTAKDFRTWGGTVTVARALAETGAPESDAAHDEAVLVAVDVAAERLGNTRDVARASYLSPVVTEAHRTGALLAVWTRTRRGKWASRAERTTARLHDADI